MKRRCEAGVHSPANDQLSATVMQK